MYHCGLFPKHMCPYFSFFFLSYCVFTPPSPFNMKGKIKELRRSKYLSIGLCFYRVTMAYCLVVGRHYDFERLSACALVTSLQSFRLANKMVRPGRWSHGQNSLELDNSLDTIPHKHLPRWIPAWECGLKSLQASGTNYVHHIQKCMDSLWLRLHLFTIPVHSATQLAHKWLLDSCPSIHHCKFIWCMENLQRLLDRHKYRFSKFKMFF